MSSQAQVLTQLTSYSKYYKTFNNDEGTINNCSGIDVQPDKLKSPLESKFNDCKKITADADKIAKAYCSACNMNTTKKMDGEPCYFFYHWLGDKYWNDLGNKNFLDLLREIHETLRGNTHTDKCRFQYSDVNDTLLPQMKKVFDYYYDHKIIQKNLLKNLPKCEAKWMGYLEGIASACITIRADCKGKDRTSTNSYCSDFHTKYMVHCGVAEALNVYCTEASTLGESSQHTSVKEKLKSERHLAQQEQQSTLTKLEETLLQANKASSLSSAFGTIAALELPAALFLLYKYKPWSSWFGNHSSGNGERGRSNTRKRRSTRNEFDTLTDDASTITDSIIGDSTTADDSTTVHSTAYTRQATGKSTRGRTRTNNTPGHHQRTNVGYGRM
ncbi:KIR-like protein [Plasmodium coatneyi]|uniref:KIR-like protein n=1 Tax=Plasmodium coatneyi TaxID=208452 RepID=A0A1B1DTX8_9APIC|nr:KIR-like protein [Plasmodium coatneyi]ANQ06223.1 KIR-like protein [Plasmodium coatneyi]